MGQVNYSKSIFEGKYYAKPATGCRDQLCHQNGLFSVRGGVRRLRRHADADGSASLARASCVPEPGPLTCAIACCLRQRGFRHEAAAGASTIVWVYSTLS